MSREAKFQALVASSQSADRLRNQSMFSPEISKVECCDRPIVHWLFEYRVSHSVRHRSYLNRCLWIPKRCCVACSYQSPASCPLPLKVRHFFHSPILCKYHLLLCNIYRFCAHIIFYSLIYIDFVHTSSFTL
jgi:hypothetical protein